MQDPLALKTVTEVPEQDFTLQMDNIPDADLSCVYNIYDEKDFKKYINDVEKCVRGSFEYRCFIDYIRKNMGMYNSFFLEDISGDGNAKVRIEQHHTPFTLYDIVLTVFNKRMFYQEDISIRQVAKEVMELHYRLLVGLVPLTKTEHKLVHEGYLFVPADKILGNYNAFVDEYKSFMLPEYLDTLERIEKYSKNYYLEDNNTPLQQHTIKIDAKGSYALPDLSNVVDSMFKQIQTIKDNGYRLPVLQEEIANSVEQEKPKELHEAIYFF